MEKIKIALLGNGKTGSKVAQLLNEKKIDYTLFDSKNRLNHEALKNHDIVISFLTGEVFKSYIDLLIESKIPVVSGSTGITYGKELHEKLISTKNKWIVATNFSLGMNLIYQMIQSLKKASLIFEEYNFSMKEIHHIHKLDAPSGTALSWKKWLGEDDLEIQSQRVGDVIGIHELTLKTPVEEISLSHKALDRMIFAQGALYAANEIKNLNDGLHFFEDIIKNKIKE